MDPFAHHPELRDRITPPEKSFFHGFTLRRLEEMARAHGMPVGWWYDDETREAMRSAFLADHVPPGDIWVFGYGSLIWDPAFPFVEVRRAFAHGHARRFILREDNGGRGTPDAPGLMAALDVGGGCHGLAFRVAADAVDAATEALWRREVIAPGYVPAFIPVRIGDAACAALTFLANHDTDVIESDLPHETRVEWLATGAGILGTSRDYLASVAAHMHDMGIPDPALDSLLAEVDARRVRQD